MVFFTTGYGIFFLIGASMPWRIALGLSAVVPILTLIGLKVCPETPIWLLRHGKPDQVVKSLQFLRGDDEVVRDELASMEATLEAQKDEIDHDDGQSKMTRFVKMFGRRSFVHPFLLSLSLFIFGNEFAGFPAMNFYLVNLLQVCLSVQDHSFSVFSLPFFLSFIVFRSPRRRLLGFCLLGYSQKRLEPHLLHDCVEVSPSTHLSGLRHRHCHRQLHLCRLQLSQGGWLLGGKSNCWLDPFGSYGLGLYRILLWVLAVILSFYLFFEIALHLVR